MPSGMKTIQQNSLDPQPKRKMRLEAVLGLVLLLSIGILIVTVVLSLPAFTQVSAQETAAPTTTPTTAPTEPEITEPTLPPPEENPYGRNDFQYDQNNHLYTLHGESMAGIDVSKHQGEIDWQMVSESGIEFAMIRVAYRGYGEAGTLVEDPYARANLQGAADAGLDVGVYLFSQALSPEEALEEAEFLLAILEEYREIITLPVVFDWERVNREGSRTEGYEDMRTLTDSTLAFCQRIEEAGFEPMVYFNTFHARNLLNLAEVKQYEFWLALYSDRMRYPYKVDVWQYTDSGSVPGINAPVDLNVWMFYSEDEPEDIPEEVPEDTPEDVPEDGTEDVTQEVTEKVPEETPTE